MPLIKATDWVKENFAEGSRPCKATISRWVTEGEIEGTIIGRLVFIESDALDKPNRRPKPKRDKASVVLIAGKYTLKS